MPAEIRPHIKVHKSPELSRLQVEAGAIGMSVATVWEAIVLVRSGLDHVFVVNTIAGPAKLQALAELAREADVMVAVDDPANVEALGAAARAAGSQLGVLIEIDTGMDRCGVDTADEALTARPACGRDPGLRLIGLTGYEGHCSLTPDHDLRLAKERTAMAFFVGIAERLEADGLPCPIRSAGGTATWDWTAAFPGITEIQAGTYVVMDNFHGRMVGGFEHSLTVQATVISRRPDRVVLDAGNKSMGAGDLATIVGHPLPAFRFDEEHGVFDATGGTTLARRRHRLARPGLFTLHRQLVRRLSRRRGRRRRRHLAGHPARTRPSRTLIRLSATALRRIRSEVRRVGHAFRGQGGHRHRRWARIGRATAESFAEEGAGVVLFGWHADVLEDTAAGIREKGGRCEVVVGDVSKREDVQRAVQTCSEAFGRHDYMVANAGIADFVPFLEGTDESWDQQIGIDLKGTWLALQEGARQMVKEGHGGAMVVVSSTNAYQPEQEGVFYNTSKSGPGRGHAHRRDGAGQVRHPRQRDRARDHQHAAVLVRDQGPGPVESLPRPDADGSLRRARRDGQADPVHVLR